MRRLATAGLALLALGSVACNGTSLNNAENNVCPATTCPSSPAASAADWKTELQRQLPLLGHRNWIVIADMAYPLQTNPGITTLYSGESYGETLKTIWSAIGEQPHVFAHVYQDRESEMLTETTCPGIDEFRNQTGNTLGDAKVTYLPHEALIRKLDSASNLYRVIIVKSKLTLPYTTTFLELDCKYWTPEQEAAARWNTSRP